MQYRELLFKEYTSTAQASLFSISQDAYLLRQRAFRQKFKHILPQERDTPILDIGCGMGYFLWFLQKDGFTNTIGIDISPEQIQIAKQFGVKNVHVCHWQEYLADHPSQFGFILLDNVIEHMNKEEIIKLLQAIKIALKPGGKLYISTPNSGSIFGLPLAFIDFTHEVFFTAASLAQVLNICDFKSIDIYGEPLIAFNLKSWARKLIFQLIKPLIKVAYLVGTGGGGNTYIPHVIEPSLAAIVKKSIA